MRTKAAWAGAYERAAALAHELASLRTELAETKASRERADERYRDQLQALRKERDEWSTVAGRASSEIDSLKAALETEKRERGIDKRSFEDARANITEMVERRVGELEAALAAAQGA